MYTGWGVKSQAISTLTKQWSGHYLCVNRPALHCERPPWWRQRTVVNIGKLNLSPDNVIMKTQYLSRAHWKSVSRYFRQHYIWLLFGYCLFCFRCWSISNAPLKRKTRENYHFCLSASFQLKKLDYNSLVPVTTHNYNVENFK